MSAIQCNKRNTRNAVYFLGIVLLIYIPLNIFYIFVTSVPNNPIEQYRELQKLDKNKKSDIDQSESLPVGLKRIVPVENGKVELVLEISVKDLLKHMDSYSNPNGEATSNPLPTQFNFTIANENMCRDAPNLKYIIYVHSSPGNTERRENIRRTWGNKDLFKQGITRIVFMVGTPEDNNQLKDLMLENDDMHDIVMADFVDHYQNLTLKGIMGLKWVSLFCKQAPFAIKADDDAFVNIFKLMKIIESKEDHKRLITCPLWKENTMPILRDPAKCMKWCVKYTEFPGRNYFPMYCAGLSFILSRDIIGEMYAASKSTPFFWIDDVYITGILTAKVKGIEYIDLLKNFTLKEAVALEQYTDPSVLDPTIYFTHIKKQENMFTLFKETLHRLSNTQLEMLSDVIIQKDDVLKEKVKVKDSEQNINAVR